MTTVLLIRHGESAANRANVFAGNYDAELLPSGFEQAGLTAEYIKHNFKVDKVYASDLHRAFHTGKCVAEALGLEAIPNKNFREIAAGKWEAVAYDEIYKNWRDEWVTWMSDLSNGGCPGGETIKELSDRVFSELTRIAEENDGKTIAVASHATPVRSAYTLAKFKDIKKIEEIPWPSNASVSVLYYENGNWSVGEYSIDEHMGKLRTRLPDDVE